MNPRTHEQERGVSGRFGAKKPPPIPEEAPADPMPTHALQQQLARQRAANGGLLLPLPMSAERMRMAGLVPVAPEIIGVEPSADLLAIGKWLEATYGAGGSLRDLWAAWRAWQPDLEHGKRYLLAAFDDLCAQAQARDMARDQAMQREEQPAIALRSLRRRVADARERAEKAEEEARKWRAEEASLDARITAHMERHPELKEPARGAA